MPDRPADQPAVHIEFLEFFIFLVLHSRVFIPGILFMHFALAIAVCMCVCVYVCRVSGPQQNDMR